ncbi:MAG TPA: hypothetical protein VET25_00980, partial [Aestuariivirgaceae bacterium]|nr:hypothetical protein [Aestuariivirgaceae bacterium]
MASMVVDDSCTPLERIVLEFRVMAVEAVELHHVARAALLVGYSVQIETYALMLLVAGCAIETACDHVIHRERDALRAGRLRCNCSYSDSRQPLGALLQHLCRNAVRVEGCVRHIVAGETGLAVGEPIAGDET